MTAGTNDRKGGEKSGGQKPGPVRNNTKKSENTISFDRPPPQKPGKG